MVAQRLLGHSGCAYRLWGLFKPLHMIDDDVIMVIVVVVVVIDYSSVDEGSKLAS